MRLRQLVIATNKIDVLADNICDLFELKRTFSDPELIVFGLENILIPLGDTFIELVTPVKENTSAERFLKKRGGDGGYMVIVDTVDLSEEKTSGKRKIRNSMVRKPKVKRRSWSITSPTSQTGWWRYFIHR